MRKNAGLLSFLVDKCKDPALFVPTRSQGHLRFQDGGQTGPTETVYMELGSSFLSDRIILTVG